MWDGINVVFFKEGLDGMDGNSTDLPFARAVVAGQGREISTLSPLRTELVLHLT